MNRIPRHNGYSTSGTMWIWNFLITIPTITSSTMETPKRLGIIRQINIHCSWNTNTWITKPCCKWVNIPYIATKKICLQIRPSFYSISYKQTLLNGWANKPLNSLSKKQTSPYCLCSALVLLGFCTMARWATLYSSYLHWFIDTYFLMPFYSVISSHLK